MGAELGRISGPLLAANLLRHGADLAFETDLLYLDVNSGKIGIKTDTPSKELEVNGTTTTTNLIVDTKASIADLVFIANKVQNLTGNIIISPDQSTDPVITVPELQTSKLDFVNRTISTRNTNDDINLTPDGTGRVVFTTSKVNVYGDLHATGDVTFDGNITIGNESSDTVVFNSDFSSDLIPDIDNFYDLGRADREWKRLYSENVYADSISTTTVTANNINLLFREANTIYVSVNGNDTTHFGNHPHSTFRTIKHALSVAVAGQTVHIYPGTYEETFPLTVPVGVTVNGAGIRSVTIVPSAMTSTKDGFLLNGETTVSNLTIKDFYYNDFTDTGYGFRLADNMKVTTRSPYVQNVTIITGAP